MSHLLWVVWLTADLLMHESWQGGRADRASIAESLLG